MSKTKLKDAIITSNSSADSTDYRCEHGCTDYCFDCAEFDMRSDDDSDDSELF